MVTVVICCIFITAQVIWLFSWRGYVAFRWVWLCGYVGIQWVWLCGYSWVWLCGYSVGLVMWLLSGCSYVAIQWVLLCSCSVDLIMWLLSGCGYV